MALVVRIDTWERIGYFADLRGPLPPGAHGCMFDAWSHPDGSLRHEPPPPGSSPGQALPATAVDPLERPSPVKLSIPVHDPAAAELELMVSPTYLDFITRHPAFYPFPTRPWRRHGNSRPMITRSLSRVIRRPGYRTRIAKCLKSDSPSS